MNVRKLPRTVRALGLVSLLTDLSSEMIVPLLPSFLLALGASTTFLGLVEGTADATAAMLKLASGWWTDRTRSRKSLVVAGYGIASLARPLIGLCTAPWQVLAIRFTDRVGKGIRGTPRDALIAEAVDPGARGLAFGFHRAMDHAGALIGPLVAWALATFLGLLPPTIFLLAAIPAAAAVLTAAAGVTETPRPPQDPVAAKDASQGRLPKRLVLYYALVGVFTLANSTDAFLLVRAKDVSIPDAQLPLLWAALHASKSSLSTPLGALSDRIGRSRMITAGWWLYATVYAGFAEASSSWQIWCLFVIYGAHFALSEGASSALVADLAPPELRGRAFGTYHFLVGTLALPASIGFGWALEHLGARTAFLISASLAAFAGAGLLLSQRELEAVD
jgi:MFS family permease